MQSLKNKEVKELVENVKASYGIELSKKDKYQLHENVIYVQDRPNFFMHQGTAIPTLKQVMQSNPLKTITVDMGAVRFVVNGADIMRPGVTKIEPGIQKDEPVCIVDEKHGKPLAVGLALVSGEEMERMSSGRAVKNLHWVGDRMWNL